MKGLGIFGPSGHNLSKLGKGPLGDAMSQISNVWALRFQRTKMFKQIDDGRTDNGQTGITKAHIGTLCQAS